jgi:hypothetical protein
LHQRCARAVASNSTVLRDTKPAFSFSAVTEKYWPKMPAYYSSIAFTVTKYSQEAGMNLMI